jgi:hypothetical protein
MAAIARPKLRENGGPPMSQKLSVAAPSVAAGKVRPGAPIAAGKVRPGAPRGSRNGNYRRGDWTTEAIEERRWLRSLVQAFAKTGPANEQETNCYCRYRRL